MLRLYKNKKEVEDYVLKKTFISNFLLHFVKKREDWTMKTKDFVVVKYTTFQIKGKQGVRSICVCYISNQETSIGVLSEDAISINPLGCICFLMYYVPRDACKCKTTYC